MSVVAIHPGAAAIPQSRIETGFRRVLIGFSIVAALGIVLSAGLALWARNELASPESVVGTHASMLAHRGTLYYDLNRYPYTISAYTPIFYCLEAAAAKLGIPPVAAGRAISLMAVLGIVALVWRIAQLYTRDRYCAWTAALLCGSTSVLLFWGSVAQVDTLAIFLSVAAFYFYSRNELLWAGVFVVLAFFTKQTALACPAAIFTHLWFTRRSTALKFGVAVGASIATLVFALNAITQGRFLADTVRANLNPFDLGNLGAQLRYFAIAGGQLIIVTILGFRRGFTAIHHYLIWAMLMFLATAAKIGSDTNYQIESLILLSLTTCLALDALDFFPLSFAGSKHWITLLQIPLGIHLVLNMRMTKQTLVARVVNEIQLREQVKALKPYFDGGRVLSMDYNSTAHLLGSVEVETYIYTILAEGGIVDPTPVLRDIRSKAFSTILLHYDASTGNPAHDFDRLPAAQTDAIRGNYKLVTHIPGPYLDGIYVYKAAP